MLEFPDGSPIKTEKILSLNIWIFFIFEIVYLLFPHLLLTMGVIIQVKFKIC